MGTATRIKESFDLSKKEGEKNIGWFHLIFFVGQLITRMYNLLVLSFDAFFNESNTILGLSFSVCC